MVNLNTPIIGEDGQQAISQDYKREPDGSYVRDTENKPIKIEIKATLYKLIREALLSHNGDTDPVEIEKRYDLFLKIQDKEEIEFTDEETILIVALLCKKFDVMFSGQAIKLLKK